MIQKNVTSGARQKKVIGLSIVIVLMIGVLIWSVMRPRKVQGAVGAMTVHLAGAKSFFVDNGSAAGNEQSFTIQGQKTKIHVDFNNLLSLLPIPTLANMKSQADDWRRSLAKIYGDRTQTVEYHPFHSPKANGYYLVQTLNQPKRGGREEQVVEQRNLFFLEDGQPYKIHFWFTRNDSTLDNSRITETWNSLLSQVHVDQASLRPEK